MLGVEVIIGGTDVSATLVSVAKAVMISVFNMAWRAIAIKLSNWENYRLTMRMRENLTYKLFIFQCINCYFMLIFAAFFLPTGAPVFGINLGRCHVRPPPGVPSCADGVASLLYSILFTNIFVGQLNEVGLPLFALARKRCCRGAARDATKRKGQKGAKGGGKSKVGPADDEESGGGGAAAAADGPSIDDIVKKKKQGKRLTAEETRVYEAQKVIVDLVAEYERPLVKSVQQGLGNTFYEYNELALQYGYVVLFSLVLPAAPLLAFLNNFVEIRSDAFKTVYAQRRTRAEAADDIGPWALALKLLSYAGLLSNLGMLTMTTEFFDELTADFPVFYALGPRLAFVMVAEHLLLALKLFVDFIVPDVPSKIRVRLARDEHIAETRVNEEMASQAAIDLLGEEKYLMPS